MRVEIGELSESEYQAFEEDISRRLREIRERRDGGPALSPSEYKITGIDARFEGDEHT
jgi:hypothetical protein